MQMGLLKNKKYDRISTRYVYNGPERPEPEISLFRTVRNNHHFGSTEPIRAKK
jgi:hypothetical protein